MAAGERGLLLLNPRRNSRARVEREFFLAGRPGKHSDGRILEKSGDGDFQSALLPGRQNEIDGEQGIPSKIKKIVMDSNILKIQQLHPEGGDLPFQS